MDGMELLILLWLLLLGVSLLGWPLTLLLVLGVWDKRARHDSATLLLSASAVLIHGAGLLWFLLPGMKGWVLLLLLLPLLGLIVSLICFCVCLNAR
jgi:hypothetical protein